MLRELIQNLRQKPKMVRDNIAFGAAGTITAAVLVSWLVIDGPNSVNIGEVVAEGEEGVGVFSTLLGEIKDQAASLKEILPTAIEEETSVQNVPELPLEEQTSLPIGTATTAVATNTQETAQPIRIATTSSEREI